MSDRQPASNDHGEMILERQAIDSGHEREALLAQITQREGVIADLRRPLEQQSIEMGRMKLAENQLGTDLQSGQVERQALLRERFDLGQQLSAVQATALELEDKLNSLEGQSSQNKQRVASLETKVNELARLLRDREMALDQQQELLAHDRDIRELMGARDLRVIAWLCPHIGH